MRVQLTDKFIRTLKPPAVGRTEYRDSQVTGLVLRVTARGVKSWSVSYRLPTGRAQRKTLGRFPVVGLAEARQAAARVMGQIYAGEDPLGAIRALKEAPTVRELLAEYDRHEARHMRSGHQRMQTLHRELRPWMGRHVVELSRRDGVLLLDAVRARGAPVGANRLAGLLTRLWSFAVERGLAEDNPFLALKRTRETPRDQVLTDAEIRGVWRLGGSVGGALRLMLCTGVRPGEAAGAHHREIEADLWTVPGTRTKNGDDHVVPLAPLALEVIARCPRRGWLFPGRHYRKPIRRDSLSGTLGRLRVGFTPHDLRRTVRSRLSALGVDTEVAERVLGHKPAQLIRTYDRHDYLDEKRAALNTWCDALRNILDGS